MCIFNNIIDTVSKSKLINGLMVKFKCNKIFHNNTQQYNITIQHNTTTQ
jgi:hypothetical protein